MSQCNECKYEYNKDYEPKCPLCGFEGVNLVSEQSKRCNTYPEMNHKIVAILRVGDNHPSLYAAQRIEELEEQLEQAQQENERLKKTKQLLHAVNGSNYEKACVRAGEVERLNEQNQKLIEALETVKNAVIESKGQIWTGVSICNIVDQAIQEVQHGTSKET